MKSVLFIIVMFFAAAASFGQKAKPAQELLDAAMSKASLEKKNIFIISTATWCPPCQALKQILHDEVIQPILEKKYLFVSLYPAEKGNKMKNNNPGTLEILEKYEGSIDAVPYWFILDTAGIKLADSYNKKGSEEYITYPDSEKLLADFMNILKTTSNLSPAELTILKKRMEDLIEF